MTDPRSPPSWRSYGWGLLSAFCWGLSFVGIRVALEGLTPYGLVWTRLLLGAGVLYGLMSLGSGRRLPERADLGRCVVLGLLVSAHLLIQSVAMELTTAIRAGWIVAFIPVVVALGARVFLGERLSSGGWLGVGIATTGVALLTSFRPSELSGAGLGDLLMVGSCFTWAAYTLISVGAIRRNGAVVVAAFAMAVAVVPALAVALFTGTWHADPTARTLGAVAFLGVLANGVGFWSFGRSIQALGPQRTSAYQYIQPFITLVGSALLLGEPFTPTALAGGAVVLLGVWRVQRARIRGS